LQDARSTLIPTIAIFVSVVGTFIGMQVMGFSVNLLTLFGLVLAIGIVCDDAIVVVENVERNMAEKGLSAKDATLLAMREVTGPVIATTLVLVAVFVPVAFLGGTTGVLYKQFAITIAISVSISSFVALTLTPALAAILIKQRGAFTERLFRPFNYLIERLTDVYGVGVRWTIRLAVVALIGLGVMLWGTGQLFKIVPGSFVPPEDQGYVFAAIIMPDGASLDRTEALTERVAEIFAEHPSVQYYSALSGYSLLDSQFKTNAGTVFIALKDFDQRTERELSVRALFE
jgi:multidrug efflux pump